MAAGARPRGRRPSRAPQRRVEWEAVSLLDLPELERLTDHRHAIVTMRPRGIRPGDAYRARELVCLRVEVEMVVSRGSSSTSGLALCWLLAFNLDAAKWELLVPHDENRLAVRGKAMELCPDLFLAP